MRRYGFAAAAAVAVSMVAGIGAGSASAALDPSDLPERTRFYVNLDVEALLDSQLGRRALERRGWGPTERNGERVKAWVGFNPYEDLHQVLIYSTDFEQDEGVIVLRGDLEPGPIVERLKGAKDYRTLEIDGREVHRITHERNDEERTAYVTFLDEGAVLASSRDRLSRAVETIENGAGLSEDAQILPPQREGTFLQIGAVDLQSLPPSTKMLDALEAVRVVFGERGEEAFSETWIRAVNAERAERVKEMIEGFGALMWLSKNGEGSPVSRLLDAADLEREGDTLRLQWRYPVEDLLAALEQLEKMNHGEGHSEE